jgi:glycosyltransferase involved in cell wall biosynthesis
MRICFIAPWFPSKNPQTVEARYGIFLYREVAALARRGHEFKVLSVKWRGQSEHEIIDEKIEIWRVPCLPAIPIYVFKEYRVPHFIKLGNKIKELCNSWHPDVMVYDNVTYLTVLPNLWLRKSIKMPVIVTLVSVPGVSWFCGNKVVERIGYIHYRAVVKRIFEQADAVRLIYPELYKHISRLGIEARKVFVQTRGVDVDLFKPRDGEDSLRTELGIKTHDTVVLYVGNLEAVKGVDYLLQAAKKLIPQYEGLKFLIVGEGGLRSKYEAFARPLGDGVIFTGHRDDIPALMNISHIFAIPQLGEGQGNVIREALASGLPVIDAGVEEPIPGVLRIKRGDVDDLVRALKMLIDNPSLAKEMRQAGRKRMEEKYSWDVICQELEKFYQQAIDNFHSRQSAPGVKG